MSRKFGAAALAATLLISSGSAAFAQGSEQAALAPGKPAGVKQAAMHAPLWIWVAGIGLVGLGIGLVASGNGGGSSAGTTTSTHL
jgi:hypothetical protein